MSGGPVVGGPFPLASVWSEIACALSLSTLRFAFGQLIFNNQRPFFVLFFCLLSAPLPVFYMYIFLFFSNTKLVLTPMRI